MNNSDELILLERVFLRVGSADTDEQLENSVSKYLPPVLLKLSSPNEAVRSKVMELLAHINKRIKSRSSIQLPVEALLVQYQDPAASAFITNFTIIYIKLGFPRLSPEKQSQLLPTLILAADGKPVAHQESLLYLVVGALAVVPLPTNVAQGSSFLGLQEKPQLSKLLPEMVMDLFLLPYSWTSENPPPELSVQAYQRLRSNLTIQSPEKLEQLKVTLLKFLSCGAFTDKESFCHFVIATGDTRSTVSSAADMQIRKIIGSVELDWSGVLPLYLVYLGTGEGNRKRGAASVRLKMKILPYLSKSKAIVWPAAIKVFFDSIYGEDSSMRLRSLGLTFCANIIQHVAEEELKKVVHVILEAGLLKLVRSSGLDAQVLRQAYSVIGQLVCRLPSVVANDITLLETLFTLLAQESDNETGSSIRDCMVAMSGAYKRRVGDESLLMSLLTAMLESSVPRCRSVAVHYVAVALPPSAKRLYILLSAASHPDEDISREGKKALYGPGLRDQTLGGHSKDGNSELGLPDFTELLTLILEKEASNKPNPKLHTEIIFYLRLCLAHAAGVKVTLGQVSHPCEDSLPISVYLRKLHETMPLLLEGYLQFIFNLLEVQVCVVALAALLEVVGCLQNILVPKLRSKVSAIKGLIGDTKEEVRRHCAALVGMVEGTSPDAASAVEGYTSELEAGGRNLERLHGVCLTLACCLERGPPHLLKPNMVSTIVKYLTHKHALIVGAACSALAILGRARALPVPDEDKVAMTDTLLTLVLDDKNPSKVRDRACNALAMLCVGENFPCREKIVNHFLDSAKLMREIELHLSSGEVIVNAILGATSPDAVDPWTREAPASSLDALSDTLALGFLKKALPAAQNPHPFVVQSCCFWLLAVTKHCLHLESISTHLNDIQAAFMDFLSNNNSAVQEAAGKGLALVYQGVKDASARAELLGKVVEQLTLGKRAVNKVADDTKLFEEGELGKTPSGGNLSTYKELCSLASELNKPDLIYKFMHLANHNAIWNSKKGAAYGVSSLVTMAAGEELEAHLPRIVAKMYRYQFDPTPAIQSAMVTIWHSLTSSTPNATEKYYKEILADLLVNVTAPQWRVRISCCQALADFMRGPGAKMFDECPEKVPELWRQLLRVMDDMHEATREAATNTTRILSKICIRHCEKELGKSAQKLSAEILPVLMEVGMKSNVSEIRAVSVSTLSEIVKNGLPGSVVSGLVVALLIAAGELESAGLNALSVMASANRQTQEVIDSVRASAVRSHSTVQTLARCVEYVTPSMLEELVPQMTDLMRGSVGLGTRVATAHFMVLLSHHLTIEEMQPFVGKLLGSLLSGLSDRNSAIRKTCATTIGQITRYAKDTSVERLLAKLAKIYFEKEEENSRSAVCFTLQALVTYSQDAVKNRPDLTLPLVFFAKHQERKADRSNTSILDAWDEVWEEVCTSPGTLVLHQEHVVRVLEETLGSQVWTNKAQAARAIKTLALKLGDTLPESSRDTLFGLLVGGLSGRTWDGKHHLLDALASLAKHCPPAKGSSCEAALLDALLKEVAREKVSYRCHALRCLADTLNTLQADRFQAIHPVLSEIIHKNIENEVSREDAADSSRVREELTQLKEAAYETLGKAWPHSRSSQEKYWEEVVGASVDALGRVTRREQVSIMASLVIISERLFLLHEEPPLSASDSQLLKAVSTRLRDALHLALGISKHTQLRKESLNLIYTLAKPLKKLDEEEFKELKKLFDQFSEDIARENAPEIKSRYIDLKEALQAPL